MYSMFDTAYNMGFADFADRQPIPYSTGNLGKDVLYDKNTAKTLRRPVYEKSRRGVSKGSQIVPYAKGGALMSKKSRPPKYKPTLMDLAKRHRRNLGLGAAGLGVVGGGALAYGAYKNSKKRKRNRFGF